jgi:hypothetical protein
MDHSWLLWLGIIQLIHDKCPHWTGGRGSQDAQAL